MLQPSLHESGFLRLGEGTGERFLLSRNLLTAGVLVWVTLHTWGTDWVALHSGGIGQYIFLHWWGGVLGVGVVVMGTGLGGVVGTVLPITLH